MRGKFRWHALAIIWILEISAIAQTMLPGHYIGYATNSPTGIPLEIFAGLDGDIAAKYGEDFSRRVISKPNGRLIANFSPRLRFHGLVSADGSAVDGRLFIHAARLHQGPKILYFHLTTAHEMTPVTLTGVTMWMAHPDGYFTENTGMAWDTFWGEIFNVYLFSGTLNAPVFFNMENTDASLNPNLQFHVGSQKVYFCGEYPFEGTLAMNFYFDHQSTTSISALVPTDGSHNFSAVASGLQTFAGRRFDRVEPSAGTLSFVVQDFRITLTDFQVILPRVDIVGPIDNNPPYPAEDTTGGFTLTVIPESWTNLWSRQQQRAVQRLRR